MARHAVLRVEDVRAGEPAEAVLDLEVEATARGALDVTGGGKQPDELHGLVEREVLRRSVEVVPAGCADAVERRPELGVVDVELQHPAIVDQQGQLHGQAGLDHLAPGAQLLVEEEVLRHLLGDGRSGRVLLAGHVRPRTVEQLVPVEGAGAVGQL